MFSDKRMDEKLYNNRRKYTGVLTMKACFLLSTSCVLQFSYKEHIFLKLKNHNYT